jgi:hypothetical protein
LQTTIHTAESTSSFLPDTVVLDSNTTV